VQCGASPGGLARFWAGAAEMEADATLLSVERDWIREEARRRLCEGRVVIKPRYFLLYGESL
jgi:hypothetical protein